MTSTLRILSTGTADLCAPAVLFTGPTGKKILVNCGEGCQRSFLEYKQAIKSVSTIALCSLSANILGGLPGFILTSADTNLAAMNAIMESQKDKRKSNKDTSNKNIDAIKTNIIGPSGLSNVINSLRSFMNRGVEKVPLNIIESPQSLIDLSNNSNRNGRKGSPDFFIRSIPFEMDMNKDATITYDGTNNKGKQDKRARLNEAPIHSTGNSQVMSYIFTTPPIPGKFNIVKARELGIPKGPLYARLQGGQSITFKCSKSQRDVTVQPTQVMSPTIPGVSISIIYCPSEHILAQIESNVELSDYFIEKFADKDKDKQLNTSRFEIMIHMTPSSVINSDRYTRWLKRFGADVEHVILNSGEELDYPSNNGFFDESPFRDYQLDCIARHFICKEVFPVPISWDTIGWKNRMQIDNRDVNKKNIYTDLVERFEQEDVNFFIGRNMLEYTIIPRHKRGFDDLSIRRVIANEDIEKIKKEVIDSDATTSISDQVLPFENHNDRRSLIFTGTGSAIPSKTRNVSGMYITSKSNDAKDDLAGILFDPGEGTMGNLYRLWKAEYGEDCDLATKIRNIKLVWISHPHADHHLGILRLLYLRSRYIQDFSSLENRLIIVASSPIFDFLNNYTQRCATDLVDTYHLIPAHSFQDKLKHVPLCERLQQDVSSHMIENLGINDIKCVPVSHCNHAYAVLMDLPTSWGKIAYSGDCRPSLRFAKAAQNCDILIHEATFDNDLKEDAILKQHCTVNEALNVGREMNAGTVILTHFSQRYPKFLDDTNDLSPTADSSNEGRSQEVIFAFDGMILRPHTTSLAAKLTNNMSKLYSSKEENDDDVIDKINVSTVSSKEILNTPGLFAVNFS